MMNSTRKFQSPSGRKAALWGVVAVLSLLVALSLALSRSKGTAEGVALDAQVQESPATTLKTGKGALRLSSGQAGEQRSPSASLPLNTSTQTRTITYTYDNAGRLVGANYGEGQGITYTYDNAGNLLQREVYGVATATPTPTSTPTATPTNTPTPTPTATVMVKVYLPILVKDW
jgi:YD repeat-containing protein